MSMVIRFAQFALLIFAVSMGFIGGRFLIDAAEKQATHGLKEAFRAIDEETAERIKQNGVDAEEDRKQVREIANECQATLAWLAAVHKERLKPIRQANDEFVASMNSELRELVRLREQFVASLESKVPDRVLATERKNMAALRMAVGDLQRNLNLFDEDGEILSRDERNAAIANANEAFVRIQKLKFAITNSLGRTASANSN